MSENTGEKKKKKSWGKFVPALAALVLTGVAFFLWPETFEGFATRAHLWRKVLWPLCRGLFFMSLGLFIAMLIESMGWTIRLGRLAAPLTRLARLPDNAAASFTVALVSTPTANAMLAEDLKAGKLSPRALAVTNLLNASWPTFIIHLPSTFVVATSFTGAAGLAYMGIMFFAATLRLFGAALLGRLILPPMDSSALAKAETKKKTLKEIWPGLQKRLTKRLKTLFLVAAPIFYITSLAAELGFFRWLQALTSSHFPDFFLPVEAAALVIFSLSAEFSSGFVAAGALLNSATLTMPQAAAALILGNIISTPIRVLRWQLPYFLGFFETRLGLTLILCNQGFRILSLSISLFLFWFFASN